MALRCGIVGLPNIGKSTLFNALCRGSALCANFPFATIEPNVGVVVVPDERMKLLESLVKPKNSIPAFIEFVDIAGLVQGASRGEGLGNKFLAHIREVDAIVHVIRCFRDDTIVHVAGGVDPLFDKEIIDSELRLKDIEMLDKRITKLEKLLKDGTKEKQQEYQLLCSFYEALNQDKDARDVAIDETVLPVVRSWQLLTGKPVIYAANVDELTLKEETNPYVVQLQQSINQQNTPLVLICAALETQLNELNTQDKLLFLQEYGLQRSSLEQLIQISYALLDLITYFTVGPQEVRAWTIKKGTKAPQAAGIIHSDFERGFIKAEVIKLDDYQKYKTELGCKEAGKLSVVGKEYVVQDGDIIHFRFNV